MDEVSIDAPVLNTHNDYLLTQTNIIRMREIPWEGYRTAGILSSEELNSINAFTSKKEVTEAKSGQASQNIGRFGGKIDQSRYHPIYTCSFG